MRLMALLLLAITLFGCASGPRVRFNHQGATREQFIDVSYQCQKAAGGSLAPTERVTASGTIPGDEFAGDCNKFTACMAKNGFTRARDGDFVVSKEIKLDCSN